MQFPTSSQMNVEAANDVDPKHYLNRGCIVSVQVSVGHVWDRRCVGVTCVVVR